MLDYDKYTCNNMNIEVPKREQGGKKVGQVHMNIKPNERVRAAMIMTGHSQESMAKSLGIAHSTFNQKLNGRRDFSLPECKRIAAILGRTLDEIFFN